MSAQYYLVLHIYECSTFDKILDNHCSVIDYCNVKSSVTILQRFLRLLVIIIIIPFVSHLILFNNVYFAIAYKIFNYFPVPFHYSQVKSSALFLYKNEIHNSNTVYVNCILTLSLRSLSAPLLTRSLAASTRPSSAATCSGV